MILAVLHISNLADRNDAREANATLVLSSIVFLEYLKS
jgi:hypothetical protein